MTYGQLQEYCKVNDIKISRISEDIGFERTLIAQRISRGQDVVIDEFLMSLIATALKFESEVVRRRSELRNECINQRCSLKYATTAWMNDVEKDIEKYSFLNKWED